MATILIPVTAESVPESQRERTRVRVAIKSGGQIHSELISLRGGRAEAKFDVNAEGPVTVAIGPEASAAAELFNKATPSIVVSPGLRDGRAVYEPAPIVITEPIWRLWLIWCRKFTISGTVYGPDGNPVPSAAVTAFNVDRFWWWSSTSQVGTAITDPAGNFTLSFEWCCGWLPWYWWSLRDWRLDPVLVDKLAPVLALNPQLRFTPAGVKPVLGFTELNPQPEPPGRAGGIGRYSLFADFNPQPDPPGRARGASRYADFNPQPDPPGRAPGRASGGRQVVAPVEINPVTLPTLRQKLLGALPLVPEFERFCLWPWCPWWPWLDCDPNIIFRVSQSCGGAAQVILNETVWQARDNIPTDLSVILTADADACTIPPPEGQPEGDCFLFTAACGVQASEIGLTCDTSGLNGLAYPGSSDRPFTGQITLSGQFGTAAQADYYQITYRPLQPCTTPPSTIAFVPAPPAALSGFTRTYFDATQPYPNQWFYPPFDPIAKTISGGTETVTVYQSRQFFEQSSTPPANWGSVMTGRSWTNDVDGIAVLQTAGYFADGAYEFQIVGYTANADGSVTEVGPLAGCGQPDAAGLNDNNDAAIYFANPTPAQTEPDATISQVVFTVNGGNVVLPPCGILNVPSGASLALAISFTASDAEGFLDEYYFTLQGGASAPAVIGAYPSGPVPAGSGILAASSAAELGPTYSQAVAQGAVRPNWSGGAYVLTIADATPLFPQSCAYELQLYVYKRNIVDCRGYDDLGQAGYYAFTILYS